MSEKAIEKIAEEGFDPEYGARPLRRSIQKKYRRSAFRSFTSGRD